MRTPSLLLVCLLVLSACNGDAADADGSDEPSIPFRTDATLTVSRDGQDLVTLDVEVADDDSSRTRGMMQRDAFPNRRSGMLFIFERERPQSFWMANTPLSLDLIFASADSLIVDIDRYARPFSQEQIRSDAPAQYVLEVAAGFADSFGLTEGDRLEWTY